MSNLDKSKVYQKAYPFAVRVIKLYQHLCESKKEYVLSKQILKCGTSIGANVAISKKDFSSKLSIAYKEGLETQYWLSLLKDTNYISVKQFKSLFADVDELNRMLFSILKSSRINTGD
jgi:four helix bundle protein